MKNKKQYLISLRCLSDISSQSTFRNNSFPAQHIIEYLLKLLQTVNYYFLQEGLYFNSSWERKTKIVSTMTICCVRQLGKMLMSKARRIRATENKNSTSTFFSHTTISTNRHTGNKNRKSNFMVVCSPRTYRTD